ncbi:MAG: ABC transporter permease [Spirochaetes bacterium]|nr:ABC transporter permease [Spirochaetota bacterium]
MIELKNISKIYKTGQAEFKALDNVSLEIKAGEFVAIMGPSGSGKSTMLNILGFLDKPDSGSYLLLNKEISNLEDDELSILRNHIAGFVFQQFHLLPRMTALGNAELPLIYAGKRDMKHAAKEKIRDVGLAHRESHSPNEMSGGEQQRVAIARSMVNEPLIIFADEPTGNLDTRSEEEILAILDGLNENGKTIIMVTHEDEIAKHAKRIIRMRDGRIVSDEKKISRKKIKTTEINVKPINEALSKTHSTFGKAEFMDFILQATGSIFAHKMRSLLSMLGILIGVAAVISMMALGEGAKESVSETLSSLGSNILAVMPGSRRQHGVAMEAGSVTRIEMQDANAISQLKEVKGVSPTVAGRAQIVFMNNNWNTVIRGVGTQYETMRNSEPILGRFFNDNQLRARDKVALIGTTVVKELFGDIYPIGKEIKINKINFIIIGVLPQRGASFFRDQDDVIIVPVTTAMYRLLGKTYLDSIDVEVKDPALIDSAISSIKKLIIKRHRLTPDKESSFEVRDTTEIRDMMTSTTRTFSILLGSVAAISLLVGGIGIMNIMLVSVKERTKEIGLRKAIGARRADIRLQFLIESALMTLSGGLAGIVLGAGISTLLSVIAGWSASVSLFSILLSSGFSVLVGVCFGFYPAVQASRLNPIEALRYE